MRWYKFVPDLKIDFIREMKISKKLKMKIINGSILKNAFDMYLHYFRIRHIGYLCLLYDNYKL